jgi:hypothetical protein
LLGFIVSLPIQKSTTKNWVAADSEIDNKNCIAADSEINTQFMPLPIQKSATKLRRCRFKN